MGSCEDLIKDACHINNESEETITYETNECLSELETDTNLKALLKCQKEIDELGCNEFYQILEEVKTFDEDCNKALKELFIKRSEVTGKIPGFWINAIRHNNKLPFIVNGYEVDCLTYLMNFIVEEIKDEINGQAGLILSFTFHDNPYLENKMLSKMFSWRNDGIIMSTNTPITWKKGSESSPLHDELVKSLCSATYSFFEWFTENETPKSINFLQILELWYDPLKFFKLSSDSPVKDDPVSNTYLEEVRMIQDEINKLNKNLDDDLAKCTSRVGEASQEVKKNLYDERNRLIKTIPNFWPIVLVNHPDLYPFLEDDAGDCLQYLTNIELEDFAITEETSKMKISFSFTENPYMTNTIISREFTRKDGQRFVKSTQIEWKEGKCLFGKEEVGDCKDKSNLNIFDWFSDDSSTEAHSQITLPLLQIWDNPVPYYVTAISSEPVGSST